jgi:hypothetical protein
LSRSFSTNASETKQKKRRKGGESIISLGKTGQKEKVSKRYFQKTNMHTCENGLKVDSNSRFSPARKDSSL